MKKYFVIWAIMLLVLVACASAGAVNEVQSTSTIVQTTIEDTPTMPRALTATTVPPTSAKTSIPSPAPTSTQSLTCKIVPEIEFQPGQLSGKIVLDDHHNYNTNILDLDSGEVSQLTLSDLQPTTSDDQVENLSLFAFSPDFQQIVLDRSILDTKDKEHKPIIIDDQMVILDGNLSIIKNQKWLPEWGGPVRWVSEQTILLNFLNGNEGDQIAINPMNSSQRILRSPVDLYYSMDPCIGILFSPPVWDPTLRYGIYAQNSTEDFEPGQPFAEHVMWDNQKKAIVEGLNTLNECRPTVWSPNGEAFVVAANQDPDHYDQFELYRMDLDGQITRLTSFSEQYEQANISRYSWSPDGDQIAFSLNASPGKYSEKHLAILDIASGDVTEYCLPTPDVEEQIIFTPYYNPLWSPDGKAIVIETLAEGEQTTQVVLLDLEHATTSVIGEDMAPVGWLK